MAKISDLVTSDGIFIDGDWVESKDQDPSGDVRLIQLADIGDGYYINKSHRFLTSSKASELKCTFLNREDVLIARMPDPLGRACLFPGDIRRAITVVDVCIVRVKPKFLDARWLMYFINAAPFRERISALQSGSTRKRISRRNLGTLDLPIPPRAEQTRIVEKLEELLSDLDAGVAELKAAQKKLAQYRQSLLKAAVEGTLTTEWRAKNPPTETGAQLLERILIERRARWEAKQLAKFKEQDKTPPNDWQNKYPEPVHPDTRDLPELPDGWVWSMLGECFKIAIGSTPSRKEIAYWNGPISWVSSGEVRFNRVRETKEKITEFGLENSSTQINPVGSVLLGMIGEGKTRGQVAILDIPAANNQNSAAIWVSETPILPEYVYYWLWSQYEQTRRGSSGNNQPALNKFIIERILIPLPPVAEMQEVVQLLDDCFEQIMWQEATIDYSSKQSTAQRQNILRAAFSGQLVPQDPNDEPASVLLERIRNERQNAEKNQTKRTRRRAVKDASQ